MRKSTYYLCSLVLFILLNSCSNRYVIQHQDSGWDNLSTHNKMSLFMGKSVVQGIISEIQSDQIIFSKDNDKLFIPKKAISKIIADSGDFQRNAMLTGLFGAYYGAFAGWLATGEMNTKNRMGHPATISMALGGATAGVLISLKNKTTHVYKYSNPVKNYILHEEVGEEITPAEIKLFSIFNDLKLDDEQLLLVQIVQYDNGQFLLLYDVAVNNNYQTKIKKVDSAYLEIQTEKVNSAVIKTKK